MLQLLPVMGLSLTHPTGCLYKDSWTLGVYKVLEQKPSNSKYLGGWGEGRNVRKEKNKDVGTHRAYNHMSWFPQETKNSEGSLASNLLSETHGTATAISAVTATQHRHLSKL